MGQPKRKQSKMRSNSRCGAKHFKLPLLAKDPATGTWFMPHRVNANGSYRNQQVLDVEL